MLDLVPFLELFVLFDKPKFDRFFCTEAEVLVNTSGKYVLLQQTFREIRSLKHDWRTASLVKVSSCKKEEDRLNIGAKCKSL